MPPSKLSPKQFNQLVDGVANHIMEQGSHFYVKATTIEPDQVSLLRPFFPKDAVCEARAVRGRASKPPFYSQLRSLGITNAPPFSDVGGITFQDVVVHVEPMPTPLLFHELIHTVQYQHLGLHGFAERYVRGFLAGGSTKKSLSRSKRTVLRSGLSEIKHAVRGGSGCVGANSPESVLNPLAYP